LRRFLDEELIVPLAEVIALLGPQASRTTIAIVLFNHEQPEILGPFAGTLLFSQAYGELYICAYQGPKSQDYLQNFQLSVIADLRRTASVCLATAPIEELRERTELLVAEMAAKPKKNPTKQATPIVSEQALKELSYFRSLTTTLHEEFTTLQTAEDFALAANSEDVSLDEITQTARVSFLRFETAFVHAVLGQQNMPSLAFTIDAQDDPEALRRWLAAFVLAVEARGWQCLIHLYRGQSKTDQESSEATNLPELITLSSENWPEELHWGPPQVPQNIQTQLGKLDSKQLAKFFRAALIRVKGPLAGPILRYELGLQRWSVASQDHGEQECDIHLRLRFADPRYELSTHALQKIQLPARIPKDQLSKQMVIRHYQQAGVTVCENIEFGSAVAAEYWQNIEHILFSLLGLALATNLDLLPLDPSGTPPSEEDDDEP